MVELEYVDVFAFSYRTLGLYEMIWQEVEVRCI